MKKNLLWMMALVLTCGLMSACSSDDDKSDSKTTLIEVIYTTNVSDDLLKVADLKMVYYDETGAKKEEAVTSKDWQKSIKLTKVPAKAGSYLKATPKSSIAEGYYALDVTALVSVAGTLANGKSFAESNGEVSNATKQAAEVADFCNHLDGTTITIDAEGNKTIGKFDK